MALKLISVSEGFEQYESAVKTKNHTQIKIWHKNFDSLLEQLIKNGYRNLGLEYNHIYDYVIKFLQQNGGSKHIDSYHIKTKILKMWSELECVDTLTKI